MDTNDDELLSAYLDRELSPDERALVNRMLESTPQARQRLRELEVTSQFLRTLPPQSVGTDLADAVMQRLRGESLLRPMLEPPRPKRLRLSWWVAGSLAAACMLFAFSLMMNQGTAERSANRSIARLPAAPPVVQPASSPWDSLTEGDALKLFGPSGEHLFNIVVLKKAPAPNTLLCILSEPAPGRGVPDAPAGSFDLAIQADSNQVEKLEEAFQIAGQADTTLSSPVVDIQLAQDPEALVVAGVQPYLPAELGDSPARALAMRSSEPAPLAQEGKEGSGAAPELASREPPPTPGRSAPVQPRPTSAVSAKEESLDRAQANVNPHVLEKRLGETQKEVEQLRVTNLPRQPAHYFKIEQLLVETEKSLLRKAAEPEPEKTPKKSTADGVQGLVKTPDFARPFASGKDKTPPGRPQVLLRFRATSEPAPPAKRE